MSIVLIDNVLFNDNLEERTIRYNNCIVFLILNGTSMFFGLFYLYIYFMIPKYNNISNSLSFFLSLFHLISNSFYFIIFFELYLYEQNFLSLTIKIIQPKTKVTINDSIAYLYLFKMLLILAITRYTK